jgi:type IV secretory pathway protease TraF
MQPALRPGRLLLATGLFASVKPGQVVIVRHGDIEKVKRVQRVREDQIFVVGDNEKVSVDSRSFGWLPVESVIAKVIWPQL